MAKKFLCIEVGDRLVKVSVCLGTEKKRKVKSCFFFETPDGIVVDGGITDPEEFAMVLKSNIEANGCSDAKEVHFTVASSKVATREVAMPVITDPKIASVVENNKVDYFPTDLENYKVLFRVLSRNKKKGEQGSNVLVIAMPNSIMEACSQVCNGLKLRLKSVDAICSSLADGVATLRQAQITAFVQVECTMTQIVFMRGTELLLQRSLDYGGEEMIMAYREACGGEIGYAQALEDLSNLSAEDNIRGRLTEEDVRDLLDPLVGAISRGVSFFANNKSGEVSQVVLLGACGNLLGIEVMVEEATGFATLQMAQLSTAAQLRSISQAPAYYIPGMYAGQRGLNFAVDFDPKKNKGKRAKGAMEIDLPTAILISLFLTVFAVYWAYSATLQHQQMEEELAHLNKEIIDMEYLDRIAATHASYDASKTSLLTFTENTENPNEQLLAFLAELEAKMPTELLLLSASCTGTMVNMNMTVGSIPAAAKVVSQLRSFESIGALQVSSLGLNDVYVDGANPETSDPFREVSFSVVCTYGTNVYTGGIHPYADILGILNAPEEPTA
ncbi:MAG: pilus assembly protein PilM [Eubacteriales bacterium]